jgi:hypothetical protein
MIKKSLMLLVGILFAALATGATLVLPADAAPVSPTVLPARLGSHDLVVHNTGSKSFFICTHWGYSNGETEGPDCSGNGSATRYSVLQPGHWSDRDHDQADWNDVDGIQVPAHYRLKEEIIGPNRVQFRCHRVTRWHKVSPTLSVTKGIDHHREFYLQAC